jgi:hypothetical protein
MLGVFIIFILLIVVSGFVISRRKQNSLAADKEYILAAPTSFEGLFDNQNAEQFAAEQRDALAAKRRADWLKRAEQFDLSALDETSKDAKLYEEVFDELLKQASASQDNLQRLVRHLSQSKELRGNPRLTEMMIAAWNDLPDNQSTAQMLHIAALSDDAALLQTTIELALAAWQKGQLPKLSAKDFLALIESEYWVLAPQAAHWRRPYADNLK